VYSNESAEIHTVGIVGAGVVGMAMAEFFGGRAVLYDPKDGFCHDRDRVNACRLALICVPTPPGEGGRCRTHIVAEAVRWLQTELIVICSTVAPGTTDDLRTSSGKRIVFQPEYIGETPAHPFPTVRSCGFIVLGGERSDTAEVAAIYRPFLAKDTKVLHCAAVTAELAKYMENAFFATKVAFCNEFYDLAQACGVDYQRLREIWLADPRVSPDHTRVDSGDRGFSGKCLPKDLDAIIAHAGQLGCEPRVLQAVREANRHLRRSMEQTPHLLDATVAGGLE